MNNSNSDESKRLGGLQAGLVAGTTATSKGLIQHMLRAGVVNTDNTVRYRTKKS
jgi:hypothetical protein